MTCRRGDWPPEMGVNPLGIETLPREKSLELLAEVRPLINKNGKDSEAAGKICDCLGDLPLALTVAAAYLRKYKSESVGQYLKALSDQSPIQDSSLEKVALSFGVSFNKLNPENPTDALAQKLFYLASWFAPVSINRGLLIASASVNSADRDARHQADDALTRLIELGLMKEEADRAEGDARLILHRLLRDFARLKTLEGLNRGEAIKGVGAALNNFANQENHTGFPQHLARERAHLRELANQAEQMDSALAATLYSSLGWNGEDLALFKEAKDDFERALKISEAAHGPDHPEVAADVNNLGLVLKRLGDLAGARANYERALKICEPARGPDHPQIAIYVNNLGVVLQELGDLAAARANFERALKIDETVYGQSHPKVAIRVNNLGDVLHDLGDLAAARANFERALRIDEAVYGPEHPNVAMRLSNLGTVLQDLGDLAGARANIERALRIDEAVYGPSHPNVASDVDSLGCVLAKLGDLAGARANHERALAIDEAVYGPDHPNIATDTDNLGSVLQDLGDLVGARANYERALNIRKKVFGDDHTKTQLVQRHLDALKEKENKQKKAR
jgi:tetratricopeptide (TPR) repeat protein